MIQIMQKMCECDGKQRNDTSRKSTFVLLTLKILHSVISTRQLFTITQTLNTLFNMWRG